VLGKRKDHIADRPSSAAVGPERQTSPEEAQDDPEERNELQEETKQKIAAGRGKDRRVWLANRAGKKGTRCSEERRVFGKKGDGEAVATPAAVDWAEGNPPVVGGKKGDTSYAKIEEKRRGEKREGFSRLMC